MGSVFGIIIAPLMPHFLCKIVTVPPLLNTYKIFVLVITENQYLYVTFSLGNVYIIFILYIHPYMYTHIPEICIELSYLHCLTRLRLWGRAVNYQNVNCVQQSLLHL